jgi:cation diffusion facilitator CzcD-associated flavoprotein CzcO
MAAYEPPLDVLDALIIGSGFGGLCMGIKLKAAGLDAFEILERADDLGGTWRDNRYPGCACDVPANLYSFSFDPNPGWSRTYAPREEIWTYLRSCAQRFGLGPHLRFDEEVVRAELDEARALWVVHARGGRVREARVLVCATGALSTPAWPELPGLERFAGARFHSAAWEAGCDLRGKRVAVVGTGASAIQFVPRIAPEVARLDVYQRTPPWIIPRHDRPVSAVARWLFRALPVTQRLSRAAIYWKLEGRVLGFALSPRLMRVAEQAARGHLRRQVPDGELRRKLTPEYVIGCKRVLLSDDYYPALLRPNVELVTGGIREVSTRGVIDADGRERAADVLICASGFNVQEPLPAGAFFGRGRLDVAEAWRDGPEAYKGTAVSGFPNLFLIVGPNTGVGHSSMVYMIEAQVAYVMDAIRQMRARGWRAVDVAPEAQASWNRDLARRQRRTVWQTGCKSWYLHPNGKNTAIWPGFTFRFRSQTARFDAERYRVS